MLGYQVILFLCTVATVSWFVSSSAIRWGLQLFLFLLNGVLVWTWSFLKKISFWWEWVAYPCSTNLRRILWKNGMGGPRVLLSQFLSLRAPPSAATWCFVQPDVLWLLAPGSWTVLILPHHSLEHSAPFPSPLPVLLVWGVGAQPTLTSNLVFMVMVGSLL